MNPLLSPAQYAVCVEALYRGLLHIRSASADGNAIKAGAIADALHNLPHLLTAGCDPRWNIATFCELFLDPLVAQYPDLAGLAEPFNAFR